MDEYQSLNHTKWDCKYHVVFIPKCRRKTLYQELRQHLGPVFRQLAKQKESEIEAGHLMIDHVHMMIAIPPKYAVSQVVGFIKGKSAIHLVHPQSGEGGPASGAVEPLALSHLQVAQDFGAASATPPAASSGSRPKAPGSAGGYLLSLSFAKFARDCSKW